MNEPCYCGALDCPRCFPYGFDEKPAMTSEEESVAYSIEAFGIGPEEDPAVLEALEEDCRRICCPPVYSPEILFQYIVESRAELRAKMNPHVAVERFTELGKWVTMLHTLHPEHAQGVRHAR